MPTLMIHLAECVSAMKKDDIKTYQSNLFNLFLEALDFRGHFKQEVSLTLNGKVCHELQFCGLDTLNIN